MRQVTFEAVNPAKRIMTYLVVGAGLSLAYPILRGSAWHGGAQLHTLMEVVASTLALFVGIMALTRFYTLRNGIFLFVGAGFIGTAFLDVYHAIVTSSFFSPFLHSDLRALVPWSWVASRQFLAVMLCLSWLAWRREMRLGADGQISDRAVYIISGVLTLASFTFFAFAPLPRAYYPEFIFHRPEEFIPALFFGLALIGYLRKGGWRTDPFEHWLIIALIVSFVSQAVFMSFSGGLFDLEFDAAHTLKKVSYICVLVGLLANMHKVFRQAGWDRDSLFQETEERRHAETGMALSEHKLRAIVMSIADGIITIDHRANIQSINRSAEEIFGYNAADVTGRNIKMLMPDRFAKDHDNHILGFSGKGASTVLGERRDLLGLRKDGTTFPMELAVTETTVGDQRIFTGVVRDVTELKAAEAERQQNELELRRFAENAERAAAELQRSNAELSQFAYVASLDLQEPLRKVQAFGDRLQTKYAEDLDDRGRDYITRMQGAASRMQTLITDLLSFSRVSLTDQPFEPVDLEQVTQGVVSDLEVRVQETGATVDISGLPVIDGDPLQMRQLLQNLIGNALKYRRDGVAPVVTVNANPLPASVHGVPAYELTVTDNGIGFESQYAERIFGVFQRLHGRTNYDGTGIGLAICRKIVERHNGTIHATGMPGEGATFVIRLPATHEHLGAQAA